MTTSRHTQFSTEPTYSPADAPAGAPTINGATIDQKQIQRGTVNAREISASFGEIASLMMRSRNHRLTMLAELEWMVVPAIATRQFRVGEGAMAENGVVVPVAAVLWASVSPEVDQRLAQNLDQPMRLKPHEWRSGDIVWIVEAVGDSKTITAMLQHLKQNELKDQTVRMRVKGKDGKPTIGRVELQQDAPAAAAAQAPPS